MMLPNRIKLLKFVTLLGIGGTERQVMDLGLGLDPSRFELQFACFHQWGSFPRGIEARQIPIVQYSVNHLYNYRALKEALRFASHVRRHQIQIVHTYSFYSNVFAIPAARLAGVPVIVASIRDTGAFLTPMKKRVQKLICRLADCILVNAEAVRQWLIADGYKPENITVIHNGVDLSSFTIKTNDSMLRHEIGLSPHVPLVAVLSRLDKLKGVEYFLQAAAVVARRFREVNFLIVGDSFHVRDGTVVQDGVYRRELECLATRLGLERRVAFTGFRFDIPKILSEVAVSVLPSLSEGLSNVLLESMAMGVPVVATRVGGNPEAVEDGATGLLVPPSDPQALAHAICLLLENRELALRFGQAGRQRIIERFSLEQMVRGTEDLYLKLLNEARHGKADSRGEERMGKHHERAIVQRTY